MFDIFFVLLLFALLFPLFFLISILVKFSSKGPVLYFSDRVGKDNIVFKMPKFRTMRINTPEVATHLLANSENWVTEVGKVLRKLSLDELPQFYSILVGDMSLVGPRPALFNQEDLIALRSKYGVDSLVPGVIGWAQINGRDELSIEDKVSFDAECLKNSTFLKDIEIIFLTIFKVFNDKDISH